jgi:septal ring factor EnvC (AmiA/AmiB activator)
MSWSNILKRRIPRKTFTGSNPTHHEYATGNKGKKIAQQKKRIAKYEREIHQHELKIKDLKKNIENAERTIDRVYRINERQREAYESGDERKIGRYSPPEDLPPRDKEMEE